MMESDTEGPQGFNALEFLVAGDLHAGRIPAERLAAVFEAAARVPGQAFLGVPGDLTNDALPEQYALLKAQIARLPFPFLGVMGNHDAVNAQDAEPRARFCDAMGVEAPSYRRTIGGLDSAFLSADGHEDGCTVGIGRALPLLEQTLAEGAGPVIVFCHAPLSGTVGGAPGRPSFTSNDPDFGLVSSDAVRALIRRAGRAVVWISGHTHSPLETEGLIHTERLDGAVLHGVNASSPYFTGRDWDFHAPILLYHFRREQDALTVRIEDVATREFVRTETLPLA